MPQIAKIMIISGIILIISGIIFGLGQKYFQWFGHLPGDFRIERENFKLFIPLSSMLLVSILLSLIFWIIRKFY
jgi:hypothetical protein